MRFASPGFGTPWWRWSFFLVCFSFRRSRRGDRRGHGRLAAARRRLLRGGHQRRRHTRLPRRRRRSRIEQRRGRQQRAAACDAVSVRLLQNVLHAALQQHPLRSDDEHFVASLEIAGAVLSPDNDAGYGVAEEAADETINTTTTATTTTTTTTSSSALLSSTTTTPSPPLPLPPLSLEKAVAVAVPAAAGGPHRRGYCGSGARLQVSPAIAAAAVTAEASAYAEVAPFVPPRAATDGGRESGGSGGRTPLRLAAPVALVRGYSGARTAGGGSGGKRFNFSLLR